MLHGGEIYSSKIEYDFSVNLNPLGCPETVLKVAEESLKYVGNYPDNFQQDFRKMIAQMECVDESMVVGGNGSSELFHAIVNMVRPRKVLVAQPGFYGYEHAVNSVDNCIIDNFELEEKNEFKVTEEFCKRIHEDTDLVFIANPNNPTGRIVETKILREIVSTCEKKKVWLVVDECFLKMSNAESVVSLVDDSKYLFVVNAFTKLMAIPGIRCGYAVSQKHNITRLEKYLPEWNMSVIAQTLGAKSCEYICQTDFVNKTKTVISEQKCLLKKELSALGIQVYDSDTCFLLCRSEVPVYERLKSEKILVRSCGNFMNLDDSWFRVAIKSEKENLALVEKMKKIMETL